MFLKHKFSKKGVVCDLVGWKFVQKSVSIYKGGEYYATIILMYVE